MIEPNNSFIHLSNVSLRFRIYRNPSPALKELVLNAFGLGGAQNDVLEFFALRNLNLRFERGERVGIIGLNGAGKSTLLKAIVGIYPPSNGRIHVRGRVVPLIEVGTGFDYEMTGRENIFLNGALLARSPQEIQGLESQIIEFSGLQEFIDMPIKYYSSGMLGRLAFSIATLIEPEVLLVDEIFSTGDAQFVGKATERMLSLFDKSHIVVMVSHDMQQLLNCCNRILVMHKGEIVNDGAPQAMIEYYQNEIVSGRFDAEPACDTTAGAIVPHDEAANVVRR